MAFQFQMAIWWMVGEECVRPIRTRHSDWCNLAGIVQAIVETFPKNCALMFPIIPMLVATPSFTSTFKPASSDEDEDNDTLGGGRDFRRFETSTPMPVDSGRGSAGGFSGAPSFLSGSLPYGSAFILASDNIEAPSEAAPVFATEQGDHDRGNVDDELDLGVEADDEGDGDKGAAGEAATGPPVDPSEVEMLKKIIKPVPSGKQPPAAPKSGSKRSLTHLNGGAASSESSAEELDTNCSSARPKKKVGMPTQGDLPE